MAALREAIGSARAVHPDHPEAMDFADVADAHPNMWHYAAALGSDLMSHSAVTVDRIASVYRHLMSVDDPAYAKNITLQSMHEVLTAQFEARGVTEALPVDLGRLDLTAGQVIGATSQMKWFRSGIPDGARLLDTTTGTEIRLTPTMTVREAMNVLAPHSQDVSGSSTEDKVPSATSATSPSPRNRVSPSVAAAEDLMPDTIRRNARSREGNGTGATR